MRHHCAQSGKLVSVWISLALVLQASVDRKGIDRPGRCGVPLADC